MKTRLFALLACVAMLATSCKKDDDGKMDSIAKLYINGADKLNKSADADGQAYMTAAEITRYAITDSVVIIGMEKDNTSFGEIGAGSIGQTFCSALNNVDTINNRFLFEAGNAGVVRDNAFFLYHDFYIVKFSMRDPQNAHGDTIAYIPNAQRAAAYEECLPLEEQGKWGEIYRIFQEAFTFVPCTGKEFREMKAAGTN